MIIWLLFLIACNGLTGILHVFRLRRIEERLDRLEKDAP